MVYTVYMQVDASKSRFLKKLLLSVCVLCVWCVDIVPGGEAAAPSAPIILLNPLSLSLTLSAIISSFLGAGPYLLRTKKDCHTMIFELLYIVFDKR